MAALKLRPNRNTVGFGAVLLAMLYAGVSQNNPVAYLLAFLMLSLAAVSALHTRANLRGVEVAAEPILPVFEGEPLVAPLVVRAGTRRHGGICLDAPSAPEPLLLGEVRPGETRRGDLHIMAPRRGRYASVEVRLFSSYPLGFFTASRRIVVPQAYCVFPRPEGEIPLPSDNSLLDASISVRPEGDDFAGVRDWRAGESMRHVDWKAVARGQRVMVKQWSGGVSAKFIFDAATLGSLELEARLRQLARWVTLAERLGAIYELRTADGTVSLSRGESHLHTCLCRLAEVPREEERVVPA